MSKCKIYFMQVHLEIAKPQHTPCCPRILLGHLSQGIVNMCLFPPDLALKHFFPNLITRPVILLCLLITCVGEALFFRSIVESRLSAAQKYPARKVWRVTNAVTLEVPCNLQSAPLLRESPFCSNCSCLCTLEEGLQTFCSFQELA